MEQVFDFLFRGLKVFLFQIELDQADPGIGTLSGVCFNKAS